MSNADSKDQILEFFRGLIGQNRRFRFRTNLARFLNLTPSQATTLFDFLDGTKTNYALVLDWFDALGGRLSFPDDDHPAAKDVRFTIPKLVPAVDGQQPPSSESMLAIPMVGEVGAGPGFIPEASILGWFIVDKNLAAVRYRRNLIAVQLGKHSRSMIPTLHPHDVVLIDRDDRNVATPGKMMLVMDPMDGSGKIKRVKVKEHGEDFKITYWSDNSAEYDPEVYSFKKDFDSDWDKCIVGHAVFSWSDISEK